MVLLSFPSLRQEGLCIYASASHWPWAHPGREHNLGQGQEQVLLRDIAVSCQQLIFPAAGGHMSFVSLGEGILSENPYPQQNFIMVSEKHKIKIVFIM